jgi:hypothetical protein
MRCRRHQLIPLNARAPSRSAWRKRPFVEQNSALGAGDSWRASAKSGTSGAMARNANALRRRHTHRVSSSLTNRVQPVRVSTPSRCAFAGHTPNSLQSTPVTVLKIFYAVHINIQYKHTHTLILSRTNAPSGKFNGGRSAASALRYALASASSADKDTSTRYHCQSRS